MNWEIECVRFFEHSKGYLLGFAEVKINNWGVNLCDISLYEKNGQKWVKLPGKSYTNKNGEEKFSASLRFPDLQGRDAFCASILNAIDLYRGNSFSPSMVHQNKGSKDEDFFF